MANVSSFNGIVYFSTEKEPWTAEGFLLLYEVLQTIDASGGGYGVSIREDVMITSAHFLAEVLKQQATSDSISLDYWGNGRWSASGTMDNFNNWTMFTSDEGSLTHSDYVKKRARLLELMHKNRWFLDFEFLDEESGVEFIESGHIFIYTIKPEKPDIDKTGNLYEYSFVTVTEVEESYDHNLRNYCEIIEGHRYSTTFVDQIQIIADLLQIPSDLSIETFQTWIVENDWDEKIGAYETFDSVDDLPKDLQKEWKKYYETLPRVF